MSHQCCGRQPRNGDVIHPDLRWDARARRMWDEFGWRIAAMEELVSPCCPENLRETLFFQTQAPRHRNHDLLLGRIIRKRSMALEVLRTGYELTGWPVVRQMGEELRVVDGTYRLSLRKALGQPARAIIESQND